MKGLLLVLTIVGLARGQEVCMCGSFVSVSDGITEIHVLPALDVPDCNDHMPCHIGCRQEFERIFSNGGLEYIDPRTGNTFGNDACRVLDVNYLMKEFSSHQVVGYYNLCNTHWAYCGEYSEDYLCCTGGKYPGDCPVPSSEDQINPPESIAMGHKQSGLGIN